MYHEVSIGLFQVCVELVFEIEDQVNPASVETCQAKTDPVDPVNVSTPLPVPSQIDVLPAIVPGTDIGSIVIVAILDATGGHTPLLTRALYKDVTITFK